MPQHQYSIQQRIPTAVNVFEEMECQGYRFAPIDQSLRGGFIVRWSTAAGSGVAAYRDFIVGLLPLLDAISVVTQCAVDALPMGSFLIHRTTHNPDNVVFFHHGREREAVGMPLGKDEIRDVKRLTSSQGKEWPVGVGYLAEANRSPSPNFFLAMLVIAAEAFAGKATAKRTCEKCGHATEFNTTNREALQRICSKELYDPIYRKSPIRNKLFHGGKVDSSRVADLARRLYERLVLEFLKEERDLVSVQKIVNAPRNISYEFSRVFVRVQGLPNLLELEEESEENGLNIVENPVQY